MANDVELQENTTPYFQRVFEQECVHKLFKSIARRSLRTQTSVHFPFNDVLRTTMSFAWGTAQKLCNEKNRRMNNYLTLTFHMKGLREVTVALLC